MAQAQDDEKGQQGGFMAGQPFPNPKPSIPPVAHGYSDNDAMADAKALRKAMKGMGTDEAAIIKILGHRNATQREMITKQFGFMDGKGRSLYKDLKSELSGNFEDLVLGLMEPVGLYDAKCVEKAVKGVGFNDDTLIEILFTRTNAQLEAMQDAWDKHIDPKESLLGRVSGETNKVMGKGNFQQLCETILQCKRDDNAKFNRKEAKADAEVGCDAKKTKKNKKEKQQKNACRVKKKQ